MLYNENNKTKEAETASVPYEGRQSGSVPIQTAVFAAEDDYKMC